VDRNSGTSLSSRSPTVNASYSIGGEKRMVYARLVAARIDAIQPCRRKYAVFRSRKQSAGRHALGM
jgi:hypothetical protein